MAATVRVRTVSDVVGDVSKDGTVIHTNVRIQKDTAGRVAVWVDGTGQPPTVYAPGEVTYTVTRRPCSCKGDVPKLRLATMWPA